MERRRLKKHKSNVDRRGSKGRKIRYEVHDKLVGFMNGTSQPMLLPGTMSDAWRTDELIATLTRVWEA